MNVIVVGAGVAGLSSAFAIGAAGHNVTVFDPDAARSAARVAAGRLAPVVEVEFGESDVTALCLDANKRWQDWAADLSRFTEDDDWYQQSGMIVAARDSDDATEIRRLAEYQTSLGLDVEALTARSLRKLEPALSSSVFGGLMVRGDHMVDNRIMMDALQRGCAHHGAAFVDQAVIKASANVVTTTGGSYEADAVILAAGSWQSQIELEPGLDSVDIHPVKGQILRLRAASTSLFPSYPIDGLDCYLVPRKTGELVVGASVEDLGFEQTVTAGAVFELLKRARELVPGIDEMALVETSVGFRPATLDHAPIIGPLSSDGPFVVAGLYRNGILLAPTVAHQALSWVEGSRPSDLISPFAPTVKQAL